MPNPTLAAVTTVETVLAGRTTRIDLYVPDSPPRGAVVLAHGFMRTRATMAGHAQALADAGAIAVAPDLPYWSSSPDNARALVDLLVQLRAGAHTAAVDRIVLVGFSAGGLATLLAAHETGVVGYVGLDAFDRPGGIGLAAARTLQTPAIILRAPPSFCNAYGVSSPWVAALPNLVMDRLIEGASHCDFESPSDRLCALACGAADPARQQIVRDVLLDAMERWLPLPPAPAEAAR